MAHMSTLLLEEAEVSLLGRCVLPSSAHAYQRVLSKELWKLLRSTSQLKDISAFICKHSNHPKCREGPLCAAVFIGGIDTMRSCLGPFPGRC